MSIPVCLNEIYYDLSTLVQMKKQDPINREEYNPLEIQSGRKLIAKLDKVIAELRNERAVKTRVQDQAQGEEEFVSGGFGYNK